MNIKIIHISNSIKVSGYTKITFSRKYYNLNSSLVPQHCLIIIRLLLIRIIIINNIFNLKKLIQNNNKYMLYLLVYII